MVTAAPARQEIEQRLREIGTAFNRGDVAALGEMYTEDAVLMPPGGEMLTGRDAIRRFWQGGFDAGLQGGELRPLHIEASGDLAYEMSNATLRMGAAGSQEIQYVVIWKRQSGQWQIAVDIWNGAAASA
jgi:uncharacterized protein (TIGR02246 family)